MSHATRVEVDDVRWFKGYGPVPIDGECDHDCDHRDMRVIAWGPTFLHYQLVRCDVCMCRTWESALPGSDGGIYDSHPWLREGS